MINESLGGCRFRRNLLEGVGVSLVLKASFAFYFIGNIIISKASAEYSADSLKKYFVFVPPEAAFAVSILSLLLYKPGGGTFIRVSSLFCRSLTVTVDKTVMTFLVRCFDVFSMNNHVYCSFQAGGLSVYANVSNLDSLWYSDVCQTVRLQSSRRQHLVLIWKSWYGPPLCPDYTHDSLRSSPSISAKSFHPQLLISPFLLPLPQ